MKQIGEYVGLTKSGKKVYAVLMSERTQLPHPSSQLFTLADHYDAFAIFAFLAIRAKRKYGENSAEYLHYQNHATAHCETPGLFENFESIRHCAGSVDAFGDLDRGRSLCSPEFRIT